MADDLEIPGATAGEEVGEYTAIAAGFIPLVGGPIADIAQKAIRDRQNKRLEEFLESLSKKIQEIEDRLNQEFIKKDEAKHLFEEVLQTAEQSTQPQKLEALQSVLIVTYTSASPSYDTSREMLQLVRDLQPRHLKLLRILADPKAADAALGNPVGGPDGFITSISSIIEKLLPDWTEDQIERTWQDLYDKRLQNTPGTKTMITGLGIQQLEDRLTTFGWEVVRYLFSA